MARAGASAPWETVASTERAASQIGVEVLKARRERGRRGGRGRIRAGVLYPSAGNLGGGGFMMIRRSEGRDTIDYRETAPAAATREMYRGPNGQLIKGEGLHSGLSRGRCAGDGCGYGVGVEKIWLRKINLG